MNEWMKRREFTVAKDTLTDYAITDTWCRFK